MAGYILREDQPNIVLPAQQADRLIGRGDGDAALLYLCLLRADRGVTAQELQRRLKWSQLRLHAAETALQELGLIDRPPEQKPPEPAQERPVYTADDLTDLLTGDAGFRMLVPQTEEKLGKRLKTADLQILAGLYDDLGLPADVIYLLVCHCVTRSEERYGPGRRPTLRQIEKEGYHWAQRGLFDQESASQYLRDWNVRRSAMSRYMQVLGLGDLVLLDIKQADPERHRTLTGRDNAQTLRTAAWLEEHGKPFWLRYVLVPGYSDAEADIRALGERLGGYKQVERVEILPYHTLGVHKYEAMGKEYRLAGVQENTPEQSERAAALFREYFPTVVVN